MPRLFTLEVTPYAESLPVLTALNVKREVIDKAAQEADDGWVEEITIKEWDAKTGKTVQEWTWARPYFGGKMKMVNPDKVIVP